MFSKVIIPVFFCCLRFLCFCSGDDDICFLLLDFLLVVRGKGDCTYDYNGI